MRLPLALLASFALLHAAPAQNSGAVLRAGIIGLDTSHVPAFTKLFNDPANEGDLAAVQVVAGYPGGTNMPASRDRVQRFTEQVRGMGLEIVETIPQLLGKVDVVLLESVDGRIHLEEARQVIAAGKPLFIDKPLAGSLVDAVMIVELARQRQVPLFSGSSSRFGPDLRTLLNNKEVGDILGAATWGPCSYQEGVPELFFYGIHGVEALYTLMGPGCETVVRTKGAHHDVATGLWQGDRIGIYRGIVGGKTDHGFVAYGSKGVRQAGRVAGYEPLCREVAKFFRTGVPPVPAEETLEILAFMEAADESLRRGGQPVAIAEVLATARAEAAKRLQP